MKEIKKRNTKQKSILLEFLKNHRDLHLTPEQILYELSKNESNISQATIYRLLNTLLKEGSIRKYITEDKMPACYQYVENTNECNDHYHLICSECGCVLHFQDDAIKKLKNNLLKSKKFDLDLKRVLFYGKCENCV